MAIEKIEKKKVELTKEALIQMIGAGALVVLSFVLGWLAFSNWQAKSAIIAGFQLYEGNNSGLAKRELNDAVRWRPDHVGANEVLAKLACDAGELTTAEDHYKRVRSATKDLGTDSIAAKVGMGVVWLKRAEKASASKEVLDLVGRAQAEFRTAAEVPEGEIGLGHCELLLASKLGDAKRLAAARDIFEKARKGLGNRATAARISRDGLIDYYAGLGRVLSMSDKPEDLKEAREAFQSCVQYARKWEVPRANIMLAEARRWSAWKGTTAELGALEPEVTLFRKTTGSYWKDSRDSSLVSAHRIPWMIFSVSFAQALARNGNPAAAGVIFSDLRSSAFYNDIPDPLLMEVRFRGELALREGQKPSDQDSAVRDTLAVFDPLLKRLSSGSDEASRDRRARTLNNQAVMRSLQGPSSYKVAQDLLNDALKLYPDDYTYNRNLLLLMKRAKALPAVMNPVLEKAKAAATGPNAADFEKVQKVLDEK